MELVSQQEIPQWHLHLVSGLVLCWSTSTCLYIEPCYAQLTFLYTSQGVYK